MSNPLTRPLSETERRVVVASWYLIHYPTVEQAEIAMHAKHAGLSAAEIQAAMDEAVVSRIAAVIAEEQYRLSGGTMAEEAEEGIDFGGVNIEDIEEHANAPLTDLTREEPNKGGFADVVFMSNSGKEVEVRVDFSAGESLQSIVQQAEMDAEEVIKKKYSKFDGVQGLIGVKGIFYLR